MEDWARVMLVRWIDDRLLREKETASWVLPAITRRWMDIEDIYALPNWISEWFGRQLTSRS
jgi:hypothetical protein